jgi:hypothetical protein
MYGGARRTLCAFKEQQRATPNSSAWNFIIGICDCNDRNGACTVRKWVQLRSIDRDRARAGTQYVISGPLVAGQTGPVQPVLQAQDGSFVGIATTNTGARYMIAFDATGSVRWAVPHESRQIATDDGGVIAQSGITYDQNGNATGQVGTTAAYSWLGDSYQIGSIEQLETNLVRLAISWWPFRGGNASGSGTANLPATKAIQQLIAQIANGYVGSPQFEHYGSPACNYFVQQVLDDAQTEAPLSLGTDFRNSFPRLSKVLGFMSTRSNPASAGDWAFAHNTLKCWQNVPAPTDNLNIEYPADASRPGDVIAEAINYYDASGHVGIVGGFQQTISADSAASCMSRGNDEIIDITDYGFRADGSTQINSSSHVVCSTKGWKSKAVVKRFVCQ